MQEYIDTIEQQTATQSELSQTIELKSGEMETLTTQLNELNKQCGDKNDQLNQATEKFNGLEQTVTQQTNTIEELASAINEIKLEDKKYLWFVVLKRSMMCGIA